MRAPIYNKTCESCGRYVTRIETLKHKGKAVRVCRNCANGIRQTRRDEKEAANEVRSV